MENEVHDVAIAKMLPKQSAPHALSSMHAANTRSPYKSHTESGAVYQKMIAQQS
jgi:hypothetical protein